jgi:MFS family permease
MQHNPVDLSAFQYSIRRTVNAIGIFFFIQGICFGSWASRIPDLKAKLELSEAGLGTTLLMLPLGQMTMMPFSGRIVTHLGSRNVLRIALACYAAMLLFIGNVAHSWQLAACLYFFGLIGNLCNISVNTQGVQVESIHHKPIFATFHGLWSLGGFTGGLVGLLMMRNAIDPSHHFISITLFVWFANAIFQRFLIPKNATSAAIPKYTIRLPEGLLLQLGIVAFCCMGVEGCMFEWTGVYFKQIIHVEEKYIPLGYAAFMITMAGGRFLGDKLVLSVGRKKLIRFSGMLIFTGMMMIVFLPYLTTATIGCMITGIGVSSIIPLVYSTAGKQSHVPSGIAIATVASIGYLGFLLGPPLIGFIAEATGLQYSFFLMAMCGIAINQLVKKISFG